MRLGLSLPNLGPHARPEILEALAERAERYGFAHLWVADHVILPLQSDSSYPYGGRLGVQPGEPLLEPLATLAYMAARTERLRLGLSVLVTPSRNPVISARAMATIDRFARGRLIYGSGVGWIEEEFEALGAPFAERGAATDEYIEIFKLLYGGTEPIDFEGEHYRLAGMAPIPPGPQQPHPPVWIGGNTGRALRRAAAIGDGWQPAAVDPAELRAGVAELERLCAAAGRAGQLEVSVKIDSRLGRERRPDARPGLWGGADEALDGIARYAEAGAEHVVLMPLEKTGEALLEHVDRLGTEIVPALGAPS